MPGFDTVVPDEIKEQIIEPLKDEPKETVEVGANIEIGQCLCLILLHLSYCKPPLQVYNFFLPLLIIYSIFL